MLFPLLWAVKFPEIPAPEMNELNPLHPDKFPISKSPLTKRLSVAASERLYPFSRTIPQIISSLVPGVIVPIPIFPLYPEIVQPLLPSFNEPTVLSCTP